MRNPLPGFPACLLLALTMAPALPAHAGSGGGSGLGATWHNPFAPCEGTCAAHVFAGRQTTTSPGMAFGIADATEGDWGLVLPTPVWNFDWKGSAIAGFAFSRDLVDVDWNGSDLFGIEAELGAGQRFGTQTEAEAWAALYLRWKRFPWNDMVKTSFAISTGLSYATGISDYEREVSGNDEGSRLLHFFSPELTFALPDRPDRELVFRMHHRSGIKSKGENGPAGFEMFNYTDTGATYATLGLRWHF